MLLQVADMSAPFHTFCDDALGDHDAVELARMVRAGERSAAELIDAAIERARAAEPLAAIVLEDYARAREQARRADPRGSGPRSRRPGVFTGVPTFIKDQIDVRGLPTRYGSAAHADARPAKAHDPVAAQLFAMGLIALGKSTLPEYGFTPSTEFPEAAPTRNPWSLEHTAGGSSGGSAALVAAGVVPVAHTADGGGSTRIPAACCGLVGLKPSRGRLPDSGVQDPFVQITRDGIVSRTVRDTAVYLAEAERLRPNPKLEPVGLVHRPLDRKLKIGAVSASPLGPLKDPAITRELEAALELLESLGHEVERIDPPIGERFAEDFLLFWSMLGGLVAATSKLRVDPSFDRRRLTPFTKGLGANARRRAAELPGAVLRLRRSHRRAAEVFARHDVLVSPTFGHLPPRLGHMDVNQSFEELCPKLFDWVCFTPWSNATGTPSLSLPLGFDEASALPVGILFNAGLGRERVLLELALQLEAAAPFRRIA